MSERWDRVKGIAVCAQEMIQGLMLARICTWYGRAALCGNTEGLHVYKFQCSYFREYTYICACGFAGVNCVIVIVVEAPVFTNICTFPNLDGLFQ